MTHTGESGSALSRSHSVGLGDQLSAATCRFSAFPKLTLITNNNTRFLLPFFKCFGMLQRLWQACKGVMRVENSPSILNMMVSSADWTLSSVLPASHFIETVFIAANHRATKLSLTASKLHKLVHFYFSKKYCVFQRVYFLANIVASQRPRIVFVKWWQAGQLALTTDVV